MLKQYQTSLKEMRQARRHAEFLRDQLQRQYDRMQDEHTENVGIATEEKRRRQGLENIRKAIAAANRGISSINQALRELERVRDFPG